MVGRRIKIILWTALFLGVVLLSAEFTNADFYDEAVARANKLTAGTLSLSLNNTLNSKKTALLFSANGFAPQGFTVASLRLLKTGSAPVKYFASAEKTDGSSEFCNALDIKVTNNDVLKFQGKLLNLEFASEEINDNSAHDLVFFLAFNDNNSALKQQNCSFKLRFQTRQNLGTNPKGFYDSRVVENIASSTLW